MFDLCAPMKNCAVTQGRYLFLEGDLKYKDSISKVSILQIHPLIELLQIQKKNSFLQIPTVENLIKSICSFLTNFYDCFMQIILLMYFFCFNWMK